MSLTTSILELLLIIAIGLAIPGPNAITSFAHSGLFGKRSNISLISGMAIGLVIMEVAVGLTVDSLRNSGNGIVILHWVGMIFLLSMALAMFRFDLTSIMETSAGSKLGLKSGIGMQFLNGKEWAFIIMIMSRFIEPFGGGILGIMIIILITLGICIPAMIAWTFIGDSLSGIFRDPVLGKRIFTICGSLLVLLWVAFLIRGPV